MEKKNFKPQIEHLHKVVVAEIIALMVDKGVTEVDLLGSSASHAFVTGRASSSIYGEELVEMEVSRVYYEDGNLLLDVCFDNPDLTEEEREDVPMEYECYRANEFSVFIPCAGISDVYESVWEVLMMGK